MSKLLLLSILVFFIAGSCGVEDEHKGTKYSNKDSLQQFEVEKSEKGISETREVPVIKETIDEIKERESKKPVTIPKQRVIPFQKMPPPEEIKELSPESQKPDVSQEPQSRGHPEYPQVPVSTEIQPSQAPVLSNNFSGLGDDNTNIPPDTMGAVGPSHVMEILNDRVGFFNKSTGQLISSLTLQSFWASLGTGTGDPAEVPFDPKVLYDQYIGRFIAVTLGGQQSPDSWLLIAVSATSDPTGTWYKWYIDADVEGSTQTSNWADYPALGIDADNIYITVNMFNNSDVYQYSKLHVIPKSQLLTGQSSISLWRFRNPTGSGSTMQPAHTFGTSSTQYLIYGASYYYTNPLQRFLSIAKITFSGGTPYWTYLGEIEVTSYPVGTIPGAPQLGSSYTIDAGDTRLLNAVYRNGYLWTTHTVSNDANTKTEVAWYQINPANASSSSPYGTPTQQGRISDSSRWYYYPSIAVNSNNDAGIGFSGSSASEYAGAYYTVRQSSATSNTMQSVALLKAGLASYYKIFSGTDNRWGDYSATVIDPDDDLTFWTLQEYAGTPSGGNDMWGTWWGKFSVSSVSDTTAPSNTTSSNFINSGATSTNSTSVTLSVSATDSVGVTEYYASETLTTPSASATGWTSVTSTTSYSASVSFTLSSGDGTKTVYVWLKDAAGNVSSSVNDTIILDSTAPSIPAVSINSGASSTSSTSVTLSISATDNVGVTGYYASETSTTPSASATGWTSVTSTTSYSASISFTLSSGDGTKTVYVWLKDAAGNVSSSVNDIIILDSTAPSIPAVSINSGASSTSSTSVTLSISATDNVGVTGYYASETSTTPSASATGWTSVTSTTSYSASVSFTLSSGDGTKTVYVWLKDAAGNVSSSVNDTIILDTTAPTVTLTSPANNATGVAINSAISASLSETMDASTITTSTFTLSGGVTGTVTYSGTTATFTPSSNLSYSTTYTAAITTGVKDSAGNAMASNYTWTFTTDSASISNNPPSAPQLVYPDDAQTGLPTSITFNLKKVTDPDGDTITYKLYICENQQFTGCTSTTIASLKTEGIYYADIGSNGWILLAGILFAGGINVRRKVALSGIVIITAGMLLLSCGGGGGGETPAADTTPTDEISQTVSGLKTSTTYYWKVTADDGKGGTADSSVRSFITQ